jgi:hypothetical protein
VHAPDLALKSHLRGLHRDSDAACEAWMRLLSEGIASHPLPLATGSRRSLRPKRSIILRVGIRPRLVPRSGPYLDSASQAGEFRVGAPQGDRRSFEERRLTLSIPSTIDLGGR